MENYAERKFIERDGFVVEEYVGYDVFAGPESCMDKLMEIQWNLVSVSHCGTDDPQSYLKAERIGNCAVKVSAVSYGDPF